MKRPHIDIGLTEEQDMELKKRASAKGMCKTDYARMKLFSSDSSTGEDRSLISLKDFAREVHISESTARRLCMAKKIPYHRIGKLIRIERAQINLFRNEEKAPDIQPSNNYLLNTKQAAVFLNVTRTTILRWIKSGDISAAMVNGRYLIEKCELEALVKRNRSIGANGAIKGGILF